MASRIKMKASAQTRVRGNAKMNSHQMTFELKHKVVLALNKVADRDTYQIGVDELEKMVENLAPDKISSFLSCILDTDSEQKSAVRKECIRLMGTLAAFHDGLIGPYLAKMVASIVKRLKDPDSVVRDACVETMGVLASKLNKYEDHTYRVFVTLVKPPFEALGEQNKHMQFGSALCLARVIDGTPDPPVPILQRMLARTVKLLNNPHFMAKPAIIELNRSIIQAGGAATKYVLSTAMISFQEALKSMDWSTRKAASTALAAIASRGGTSLGSLKASCIHSLESCRFDKVKPVRDSVLVALQYWKSVPGPDTSESLESASSIKENFCGDDRSEVLSSTESGRKYVTSKKGAMESAKRRSPLSTRKASKNYVHDPQTKDDWRIEIAVPRSRGVTTINLPTEGSDGDFVTKTFDRTTTDVTRMQEVVSKYVRLDDKQECSSESNLLDENDDTKSITVSHNSLKVGGSIKSAERNQQFLAEEISNGENAYLAKTRDRRSLDSTVTVSSSQTVHCCCSQMASEIATIHKQLSEIETKQSNLMDHVESLLTGIANSLSLLQSKVSSLEYVVDGISKDLVQGRKYSDLLSAKLMKQDQSILSPRLSSCSPRPSVDIRSRHSSLSTARNCGIREKRTRGSSKSSDSPKPSIEMWRAPVRIGQNLAQKDAANGFGHGAQTETQTRKSSVVFSNALDSNIKNHSGRRMNRWTDVKVFASEAELDSEYLEVLSCGDELALIELLDRTGPVLESLTQDTIVELLSTFVSFLLEQRFMSSIIPWLQQVVDFSFVHGPECLIPSAEARWELLSAVQEASGMEYSSLAERRAVTQLATKLRQLWGMQKSL